MSAVQLTFKMRTASGVKTVHLLGSWDGYTGQLPLAKDKSCSKSGSWKGTFRFQGSTLQAGQRYWYYYIIDGYHVTHDPAQSSTIEPTTRRQLNILDIPGGTSSTSSSRDKSSKHTSSKDSKHASSSSSSKHSSTRDKHGSRDKHSSSSRSGTARRDVKRGDLNLSVDVPKGRPLSISQIQSPTPISPGAANFILAHDYDSPSVAELAHRFATTTFEECYDLSTSVPSSVGSSLSSRSGSSDGLSSASSYSDYSSGTSSPSNCSCERYGVTRQGDRIKLDCGGTRCGYFDDGGSCCSDSSQELERRYATAPGQVRIRR